MVAAATRVTDRYRACHGRPSAGSATAAMVARCRCDGGAPHMVDQRLCAGLDDDVVHAHSLVPFGEVDGILVERPESSAKRRARLYCFRAERFTRARSHAGSCGSSSVTRATASVRVASRGSLHARVSTKSSRSARFTSGIRLTGLRSGWRKYNRERIRRAAGRGWSATDAPPLMRMVPSASRYLHGSCTGLNRARGLSRHAAQHSGKWLA